MTRPLVSVIIPIYNGEKYLRPNIDSVLGQTYEPIEIIAVNDGSVDHSLEILRSYGSRLQVIDQPNSGQAAARNRAVNQSKGEFLAFLDCDDVWDPIKIERQVATLLKYPEVVAVYCDHRNIDGKGKVLGRTGALNYPRWSGQILMDLIRGGNCIMTPSLVMVRRGSFLAASGFDVTQPFGSDDWQLWMALAAQGPFLYMLETLASHRRHGDNMSSSLLGYREEVGRFHALRAIQPLVDGKKNERLQAAYRDALYEKNLTVAWQHRLRGERMGALKHYIEAIKLKPLAVHLWLKAGLVALLPSKIVRNVNQGAAERSPPQ